MKHFLRQYLFLILILTISISAQNIIEVEEGINKIDDALFEAESGDIIELVTNGGVYYEFFSIIVDMPITIRAKEGLTTRPIIYTDDEDQVILLRDDLTIQGVTLYGLGGENFTKDGIITDDHETVKLGYNLTVDNCFFYQFIEDPADPDGHAIKGDDSTQANMVRITNSYFVNNGGETISYKDGALAPGSVLDFYIENCTFWNTGDEAIYVEDHDNDLSTDNGKFTLKNVTIHNANSKSIYPKEMGNDVLLQNFIVTKDEEDLSTDPFRIYSANSVAEYFLSFNVDSASIQNDAFLDPAKTMEGVDPLYLDMLGGNFRLDPESPAVGFGADGKTLGDERWWPSTPQKITIDGMFNDWAGVEPLLVTENDPDITDSIDVKAAWIAVDDEKIAFRWDFFDDVEWNTEEESGTYNRWQGWHRVYAEAQSDGIDKYFRLRSYYGDVDTTEFTRLRWDVKSDSLDYDPDEFDGTRFTGTMAFNEEGTSCEMYVLFDSLYFPDANGNIVGYLTKEDSLEFHFRNTDAKVYLPPGPEGKLDEGGSFKVLLSDYYIGETTVTSVDDGREGDAQLPTEYSLSQNYPNPFNPTTVINYSIPEAGLVELKVYDVLGREVMTLLNREMTAGAHKVELNASRLSSGVYFYTLKVGEFLSTKKMLLLK